MRLYPYSRQKPAHRELLQTPLRRMEANILPSGEIPVWFTQSVVSEREARPLSILYGNSCTTVTANLLMGLLGYDWEG